MLVWLVCHDADVFLFLRLHVHSFFSLTFSSPFNHSSNICDVRETSAAIGNMEPERGGTALCAVVGAPRLLSSAPDHAAAAAFAASAASSSGQMHI
jgi:hypothetical protein